MDDRQLSRLEVTTLECLIQEHVRLFFLKKKSTLCALIRPCAFNKISKKNFKKKKEIFRLFYETQGCVNHSLLSSAKIIVYI